MCYIIRWADGCPAWKPSVATCSAKVRRSPEFLAWFGEYYGFLRTGKEAGGSSGARPAADDFCVTTVPEGARPAEKRGRIQDRLFSFCKIRIVNSYLILFFIEFFFHFICLFQKSIYLCMCNKQREHMNQFIHIINLAVLHIIIRVVVLKPMRWAGVHIWMSEIR